MKIIVSCSYLLYDAVAVSLNVDFPFKALSNDSWNLHYKRSESKTTRAVSTALPGYLLYNQHGPFTLTFSLYAAIHLNTYNTQDTVKLCNIFNSSCVLKKDNGFLYLLSFPSLIESQSKVKQYKGFFVSNKKHLSKHIVQGHAGAINNPLRPAGRRLVQVQSISAARSTQPGMPNKY